MTENKRYFRKLIILIALSVGVIALLSALTTLCLREKYNYEYLYEIPSDTVEVAFVGPSTAYCAFSPVRLYENYGITSVTVGSGNQSTLATYLWVKELHETLGTDIVVLEASTLINPYGDVIRNYDSIHSIKGAKRYLELFYAHKAKGLPVLAPVFLYHSNWKNLRKYHFAEDPNPNSTLCRGYSPLFSEIGETGAAVEYPEDTAAAPMENEYLDRIVSYCEQNAITLILAKATMHNESQWNSYYHNAVANYAALHNLQFIDFNTEEALDESGIVVATDVAQDGNHVNVKGANKITDYFGEYLLEKCAASLELWKESAYLNAEVVKDYHQLLDEMEGEYGVD